MGGEERRLLERQTAPRRNEGQYQGSSTKRGINVVAHFPDGSTQSFPTLLDASNGTGVKVGSVHNNLRHSSEQFKTQTGFWFEKEENDGTTGADDCICG